MGGFRNLRAIAPYNNESLESDYWGKVHEDFRRRTVIAKPTLTASLPRQSNHQFSFAKPFTV